MVGGRNVRIFIRVNFNNSDLFFDFSVDLLQDGGHHLARTAPSGVEIDQNGNVRTLEKFLKVVELLVNGHNLNGFVGFALQL